MIKVKCKYVLCVRRERRIVTQNRIDKVREDFEIAMNKAILAYKMSSEFGALFLKYATVKVTQ